jgi:hypothetical protein
VWFESVLANYLTGVTEMIATQERTKCCTPMTAANMVAKTRVGTVLFNHIGTGQVRMTDVDGFPPHFEIHCDVYNGCFPPVRSRIAINHIGLWMYEEDFTKTVEAVSVLIDNLELIGDTARRMVNLVLRHQMEAAHEARESQA